MAAVILCCWIKKTPERQILPGHWLVWKDSRGNHRCIDPSNLLQKFHVQKIHYPHEYVFLVYKQLSFPWLASMWKNWFMVRRWLCNFQTTPLDFSLVHLWRGHCTVSHSTSLKKVNQNLLYPWLYGKYVRISD